MGEEMIVAVLAQRQAKEKAPFGACSQCSTDIIRWHPHSVKRQHDNTNPRLCRSRNLRSWDTVESSPRQAQRNILS